MRNDYKVICFFTICTPGGGSHGHSQYGYYYINIVYIIALYRNYKCRSNICFKSKHSKISR